MTRNAARRRHAGRFAMLCGMVAFSLSGTTEAGDGVEATEPLPLGPQAAEVENLDPVQMGSRDIEVDPTLTPEVDGCVRSRSVVDISAPPAVVRDEILDLQARVDDSWIVDKVEVYRNEVSDEHIHRRAKWTLSVLGVEVVYHTYYDWDKAKSRIKWGLDDSKDNDLRRAVGTYSLSAGNSPGSTTVTYIFEIGTRHRITQGLKRRLTVRSVRELLDSIRTRSEESAG